MNEQQGDDSGQPVEVVVSDIGGAWTRRWWASTPDTSTSITIDLLSELWEKIKQGEIERSRAKAVEMERRLNMIPGRGFDSDVLTDEERALLSTWVTATEAIMSNDQARQLANLLGGIFAKLEAEAIGDGRD